MITGDASRGTTHIAVQRCARGDRPCLLVPSVLFVPCRSRFRQREVEELTASASAPPKHGSTHAVLIVADVRVHRESLTELVERAGHCVVGATADIEEAADLLVERSPEVVLLDLTLESSLEAARRLMRIVPGVPLVVLAAGEKEDDLMVYIDAGVVGLLPGDASSETTVETVEMAARGEAAISPALATRLIRVLADKAQYQGQHPANRLTARERELVPLIERGLSNKEIARELSIELQTVKSHVHHILEKLDVARREDVANAVHRPWWMRGSQDLTRV